MSLRRAPLEQAGETLPGPRADSGPAASSLGATPLGRCGGRPWEPDPKPGGKSDQLGWGAGTGC